MYYTTFRNIEFYTCFFKLIKSNSQIIFILFFVTYNLSNN